MISLVTCCMNRHEHLREALPTWLRKGFAEIVILDWSSTPSLAELVATYQDGTVVLAELVTPQSHFNQAKSKNLKMRLARHPLVCSLDCDVKILADDFVDRHPMADHVFYSADTLSVRGSGIFRQVDWQHFNGCNENMAGWGFEDLDLHQRMKRGGWHWLKLCRDSIFHIPHSNADRIQNFPPSLRDRAATNRANQQLARGASAWVQERFQVRIHRPGEGAQVVLV